MHVINVLTPVFLVILFGIGLHKIGFYQTQRVKETNQLVYWVGLPCLLFDKTAAMESIPSSALPIILLLFAGAVFCMVSGYLLSRFLGLSSRTEGAFVQAAFRGNLAFVGLPIVSYALTEIPVVDTLTGLGEAQLQSLAVLAFAPLVPFYNVAAVVALSLGGKGKNNWKTLGGSLLTNPLILACGLGLAWSLLTLPYPVWLSRSIGIVGQMALPLALLGVGVSLVSRGIRGNIFPAFMAAGVKVIGAPLAGWLLAQALGLSTLEQLIVLLYLACPTAIASYVMAEQLGCDAQLASNAVVLSTLLSVVSLSVILALAV